MICSYLRQNSCAKTGEMRFEVYRISKIATHRENHAIQHFTRKNGSHLWGKRPRRKLPGAVPSRDGLPSVGDVQRRPRVNNVQFDVVEDLGRSEAPVHGARRLSERLGSNTEKFA